MKFEKLFGKTLDELSQLVAQLEMKPSVAKHLATNLYKRNVFEFSDLVDISDKNRKILEEHYEIGRDLPIDCQVSIDGTKKYLFKTVQNRYIETAYIPADNRSTLCVSSQVGCKMGCKFCMTARQGFQGNLDANAILNQLASLPEYRNITNIVYMGMGEPFDNINEVMKSLEILTQPWGYDWAPKRINVSTIGVLGNLTRFLHHSKCNLAISLHSPFDSERKEIMPVQNLYPISAVIEEIRSFSFGSNRRVSFEYIMFKNFNDTMTHVDALIALLKGIDCIVNLIKFHAIPDSLLEGSENQTMVDFKNALIERGLFATIRASRGEDIFAACGLLSTKRGLF